MSQYKNDPREIRSKFKCVCAETGKTINKGETCIYYPSSKKVYHSTSQTAYEFQNWLADIEQGFDY